VYVFDFVDILKILKQERASATKKALPKIRIQSFLEALDKAAFMAIHTLLNGVDFNFNVLNFENNSSTGIERGTDACVT
jgi:hypothetical protein